ncbi:MAG: ribosomal-protein-serine acetyltransferase [Crocinitomicaceae bacterium]|jgi:ribosomal-protein-serine acetyltransferase
MEFDNYIIRHPNLEDVDAYFELIQSNKSRLEDFFAGTISKTNTREDTAQFMGEILTKIEQKTYYHS